MKAVWFTLATGVALIVGSHSVLFAQTPTHVIQTPAEAQWGPAPPLLPAGAQIAVLAGSVHDSPEVPSPIRNTRSFPSDR